MVVYLTVMIAVVKFFSSALSILLFFFFFFAFFVTMSQMRIFRALVWVDE